jgi:hypothetical protein
MKEICPNKAPKVDGFTIAWLGHFTNIVLNLVAQ